MARRYPILLYLMLLTACPAIQDEDAVPVATASRGPTSRQERFQPSVGQAGGTRVLANTSLPTGFNPYFASDSASQVVLTQLFRGLTALNASTLNIEPALAESWEVSRDGRVYTVKLKPGLKWSDGMPLTADDVLFTYQQILANPKIPNNYYDFWSQDGQLPKMERLDGLTLRFTLVRPFAPFLNNLGAPVLPQHKLGQTLKPDPDGKIPFMRTWSLAEPVENMVANGPWMLKVYRPGERVEMVPNPHYYGRDPQQKPLPYISRFVLLETGDMNSSLIKFRNGETDTYLLRPEDYTSLAPEQKKGNFTIYNLGSTPSSLFIMFNMSLATDHGGKPLVNAVRSRWFRDLRFRRALAHALNKPGLIESVYKGRAEAQHTHLSSHNPFYSSDVRTYPYDMKRAAELLTQAGFVKNDKGELYDDRNNRVEFDLVTNAANAERDATCAIIRQDWEKLGIKVNYRPQLLNRMVKQIHETHDWEVMMIGLAGSAVEPHFASSRWKTDGRMHLFNMGHPRRWRGKQPTRFEPWEYEMEMLYQQAAAEMSPSRRKLLYQRAQRLESEHLPFLYTISELSIVAVRNNLHNVSPSVYGGSGLNQVNWNSDWHYFRP